MSDTEVWVCEYLGTAWRDKPGFGPCTDAYEGGYFCGLIRLRKALKRWPWVADELEAEDEQ